MIMKDKIRQELKLKRKQMPKEEAAEKSRCASRLFLESSFYKSANVIMLYMPLGNETNTENISFSALKDGKRIVFPKTDRESGEITPIYADEATDFEKGAFSVLEPKSLSVADVNDIDIIIVPGIAFTKSGKRIGFGKGCYDRLLENFAKTKIGFCFEYQLCSEFESEAHDKKMDFIITEERVINCRKEGL